MNRRERSSEAGLPAASALLASVSGLTLSHPSLSPFLFQVFLSNAATSLGSRKLAALSPTTLPTLIRVALITLVTTPRFPVPTYVDLTSTTNRTWLGCLKPRLAD